MQEDALISAHQKPKGMRVIGILAACKISPLPFWERRPKAALVFSLNIRFENVCARDSCSVVYVRG